MCVPFASPTNRYFPLEDLVGTIAPHFAYQLQFASGDVGKAVRTKEDIKGFLLALYGGRTETGETGFDARKGVALDKLRKLRLSKLLSEEVCLLALLPYGHCTVHPPNQETRNSSTTAPNSLETASTVRVCSPSIPANQPTNKP